MLLVAALLVLAACRAAGPPHLVDTLGAAVDQAEVVFEPDARLLAPVVVVATVLENHIVQQRKPAVRVPGVLLDLHAVRGKSETLLKGSVESEFTFYYFTEAMDSPVHNPRYARLFSAETGARYIFFLYLEHGVLRSIGDVGDYSVSVLSGSHPAYRVPPKTPVGWMIAEILLKKGESSNTDAWASNIRPSLNILDRWGSRLHNIQLLQDLLAEAYPLRGAACFALYDHYNGQEGCLYAMKDDAQAPAVYRLGVQSRLNQLPDRNTRLLEQLRDPARLTFPILGEVDSRQRIFEELESLLASTNTSIRAGACTALRRYYPAEPASPQCRPATTPSR